MVRTVVTTSYAVHVTVFRSENNSSLLSSVTNTNAVDAFDYAIQAQGYFRFAIQEMDAQRIEIEVSDTSMCVHLIEITRD